MRKAFKVTPSIRKKINTLAKCAGCPLNWRRAPGIQWNTKDVACKKQDASNIIHDIAHYVMATKKDRKTLDFGLGVGPDSEVDHFFETNIFITNYSYSKSNKIEADASALGIYWEKQLGLPWKSTMYYHAWDDEDALEKAWKKLSRKIKKIERSI